MSLIGIVVFVVLAGLFIIMRYSPEVKEKVSTVWAAFVALLIAAATWFASWWADMPSDLPM